ncbi:MAG: hypothetical protein IJB73_09410 [Firmicutes bacterium]|nr:hypothetical protein [Bacillota bacterium]
MTQEEKRITAEYTLMSDEALLDILRQKAAELGRLPIKDDVACAFYFKQRFGPWPRILEQAGLKPVSEKHLHRKEKYRKKHTEMRKRSAENRKKCREERIATECLLQTTR